MPFEGPEKTVTTLDKLLPLVQDCKTCKEFGAVIIAHVPVKLKRQLALEARDALGKPWKNSTVREWIAPGSHSKKRMEAQQNRQNYQREWRAFNQDQVRHYHRNYVRERYANDTQFRLANILRTRMLQALKGFDKSASTEKLLGCTIKEFQAYIEAQFTDGMTWENQGKWEIDHIRPCASFDLEDPAQQCKCFHFTNLQPLWSVDNRVKGAKLY